MSTATMLAPPSFARGAASDYIRPRPHHHHHRGRGRSSTPVGSAAKDAIRQILFAAQSSQPDSSSKQQLSPPPARSSATTTTTIVATPTQDDAAAVDTAPSLMPAAGPRRRKDSMPSLPFTPLFVPPPRTSSIRPLSTTTVSPPPSADDTDEDPLEAEILIARLVSRTGTTTTTPPASPRPRPATLPPNHTITITSTPPILSPCPTHNPTFYLRTSSPSPSIPQRRSSSLPSRTFPIASPATSMMIPPTLPSVIPITDDLVDPFGMQLLPSKHPKRRRPFSKSSSLYRHVLLKQHAASVARWDFAFAY